MMTVPRDGSAADKLAGRRHREARTKAKQERMGVRDEAVKLSNFVKTKLLDEI
jgi:hypothetical protein